MFTRERFRNVLATVGALIVFLAIMPYYRREAGGTLTPAQAEHLRSNPGDIPVTVDCVFGWMQSPLFRYHSEKALAIRPGRDTTVEWSGGGTIGWASWSSLTLAIGIGLTWAARRMRPQ